jgi:pimeloyl-ACP methyl ester carboxylesterase
MNTVERPHGITIPYARYGPSDGAKRMLFAHSLTGTGTGAGPFFQPVVDAGWQIIAPDQRGHGRATRITDPARFSLDEMADDLLAVLDHAGWDTAWFGGGSMGVATAVAAARKAPERVEGLALMAPAFGPTRNAGADMFADIGRAFTGGFEPGRQMWLERCGADNVAQLDGLGADNLRTLLTTVPAWTMDADVDLDVPKVVLAWKDDDVHPWWLAEHMATHGTLRETPVLELFPTLAQLLPE